MPFYILIFVGALICFLIVVIMATIEYFTQKTKRQFIKCKKMPKARMYWGREF